MAGRKYTQDQIAARRAYTREWRLRNIERVRAYEAANANRRRRLAANRRMAKRVAIRDGLLGRKPRRRSAKDLERNRLYQRAYRLRMIATNPNWQRERMRKYAAKNPGYWSAIAKRRVLRLAQQRFAKTCAASRARLTDNPHHPPPAAIAVGFESRPNDDSRHDQQVSA